VAGAKWAGLHPQGVVGVVDTNKGFYSEKKKLSFENDEMKKKI